MKDLYDVGGDVPLNSAVHDTTQSGTSQEKFMPIKYRFFRHIVAFKDENYVSDAELLEFLLEMLSTVSSSIIEKGCLESNGEERARRLINNLIRRHGQLMNYLSTALSLEDLRKFAKNVKVQKSF